MINEIQSKVWESPTKQFVSEVTKIVESGISKEDKDYLIAELDELIEKLKEGQKKFKD